MIEIGYALTSELHNANRMVRFAQQAEEAGFSFAMISDHFHPFFNRSRVVVWAMAPITLQTKGLSAWRLKKG